MSNDVLGTGKIAEAAEAMSKEARQLLLLFLKPSVKELGLMAADALRILRMKSVALALTKAKAKLKAANLEINPVPTKILIPMLEGCSLEQEEDMIDRWANLLAAAACGDPVLPTYIRILSELSPNEARLIDSLQKLQQPVTETPRGTTYGVNVQILRASAEYSPIEFRRIIINLHHLGLVHRVFNTTTFLASGVPTAVEDGDLIGTTQTADDFLAVCSQPPSAAQTI
jgi:hypothetical protein